MVLKLNKNSGALKSNVHKFIDLSALSTSSVAPAFSIAASYGVISLYLGFYSIMAIMLTFPVWLGAALIFRKFNRLYPNAGASYHWGGKIVSRKYGTMQAWIITLAYFFPFHPSLYRQANILLPFSIILVLSIILHLRVLPLFLL